MPEPLRAVIVDDEQLARSVLREYLADHPEVAVVAECQNGFEAVKAATELKPDLIFLDVQMPKLNGFEVLELIPPPPAVVFVTAYDQYAIRAFEFHAVDYLLKPVSPERLAEAVSHAAARIRSGEPPPAPAAALLAETRGGKKFLDRILVRDGTKVHIIPVDNVDYIEAQDDYACINSAGRRFLKLQTLSDLEKSLDPDRFVRIHRGFILNVARMARIELYAKDSRIVVLQDGKKLPVSRAGHARMRELFGGEL